MATDDDAVFKHAGSILIKSKKADLITELDERKELSQTRSIVLAKQEGRIKENIKEQEAKINEMIKGGSLGAGSQQPPKTNPPK